MARSRYRFLPNDPAPYFVTATIVNWLPLFYNPEIVQILLDSLRFLIHQQRLRLHAYVILENHLHLVVSAEDLGKELANFKSFTARKSIDYYLQAQKHSILDQLSFYKGEHKHDRPYQFWQKSLHPQRIYDQEMLKQKIDYIHQNLVKRGYVDFPEQWRYSSTRDY
jgi:REP element-mobilizing transposase RayT